MKNRNFHIGDCVTLKGDNRLWNIKALYLTLGSHKYEALVELPPSQEAWNRTKRVETSDLRLSLPDLRGPNNENFQ